VAFSELYKDLQHLFPAPAARILDIGSGTGRDAAALAAMGHYVVAIEPMDCFRRSARKLHPSPSIDWVDDSLPNLVSQRDNENRFDLILLQAVWMHLDERQRENAMPKIAALMRLGGLLILSLRHGPIPQGKRMFNVTAGETIALARKAGLDDILRLENQASALNRSDVTWTRLTFRK